MPKAFGWSDGRTPNECDLLKLSSNMASHRAKSPGYQVRPASAKPKMHPARFDLSKGNGHGCGKDLIRYLMKRQFGTRRGVGKGRENLRTEL